MSTPSKAEMKKVRNLAKKQRREAVWLYNDHTLGVIEALNWVMGERKTPPVRES